VSFLRYDVDQVSDARDNFVYTGKATNKFPQDLAALCKYILAENPVGDLFPKEMSKGTPCNVRGPPRDTWDHRYYCRATMKLDKNGQWQRDLPVCAMDPLAGGENYHRHVKRTHLGVKGSLKDWAEEISRK
jgi:hypothetical protein